MGDKLRFRFIKVGRAKYISHLDLMATMRRALLRAGVELKYSEGFNPHPYVSAAIPLQVGYESVCELMDVGIAGNMPAAGLPAAINARLPEGLEILEAYLPERKFNEIAWLEINGILHYDKAMPEDAALRLTERFAGESIIIHKKTKRGSSDIDIAPFIRDVGFFNVGGAVTMNVKLSAQNPTINPGDLMSALVGEHEDLAPGFTGFGRIETFDKDFNVFR